MYWGNSSGNTSTIHCYIQYNTIDVVQPYIPVKSIPVDTCTGATVVLHYALLHTIYTIDVTV